MQQVISRCDLVVLILIQTLHCEIGFKSKLVEVTQHCWLNRNLVFAYDESLVVADWLVIGSVPGVLLDLGRR